MKKIILSASLFMLAITSAKAQGFYGDVSVGYGFGLPNYVMGTSNYTDYANSDNNTSENIYGSIGQGLNVALTPGYMFNKHVGIEIGLNYFIGATKTTQESITSNSSVYASQTAQSNQFRLIPGIVVSSGGEKLSVYAKGGLMIPVLGVTNVVVDRGMQLGPNTFGTLKAESEFKGNVSLGFRGALGLNYNISEKLGIFVEVQQTNLFVKQKQNVFTSVQFNGTEVVDNETVMTSLGLSKENNYGDKLDKDSKANDNLAGKTNFNQFGVNVGVKFNF